MYVELLIFLCGVVAVELYMTDPSCTFGPKLIEVQGRKLVFYSVCVKERIRVGGCVRNADIIKALHELGHEDG